MSGRKHGDEKPDVEKLPQRDPGKARDQTGAESQERHCECGAVLPKGKRLCDQCRVQKRRQTKRQYMQTYMEQRRSAAIDADSGLPFTPAQGRATRASGDNLPSTGPAVGGPPKTNFCTNKTAFWR